MEGGCEGGGFVGGVEGSGGGEVGGSRGGGGDVGGHGCDSNTTSPRRVGSPVWKGSRRQSTYCSPVDGKNTWSVCSWSTKPPWLSGTVLGQALIDAGIHAACA